MDKHKVRLFHLRSPRKFHFFPFIEREFSDAEGGEEGEVQDDDVRPPDDASSESIIMTDHK